jgi:hypothetical protein
MSGDNRKVNYRVPLIATILLLLTASLMAYRVLWLGYPLIPTAPGSSWQLTIETQVISEPGTFSLALALPSESTDRLITEERTASKDFEFTLVQREANRIGLWESLNTEAVPKEKYIAYGAVILTRPQGLGKPKPPNPPPFPAGLSAEERQLAQRLVQGGKSLPTGTLIHSIAGTAAGHWKTLNPSPADERQWPLLYKRLGPEEALVSLYLAAGLTAYQAQGISLSSPITSRLERWVQVWNGRKWVLADGRTGRILPGGSLLPLALGNQEPVKITGGEIKTIRWSVKRQLMSQWRTHFERVRQSTRLLDRWSLFKLPAEFQGAFRILLLVPIGALLICLLRNMVGFPTFGIFMPVLLAIAFRVMGLWSGLAVFAGILAIGYLARRLIDSLHLLLVPRMSLLLTLVIICFIFLALIGNQWGLRPLMAIGLLPFVILTMIIERFFVIVEEQGLYTAFLTSAGSAAVAVITYVIIAWEPLQLTFFVYPELLLAVAAAQLLIGRYTGYRLSELLRFRTFKDGL